MLETNLRIVEGGVDLSVPVRYARVETSLLTVEAVERACNLIGSRRRLGARPIPRQDGELVVLSDVPLRTLKNEDENTTIVVKDILIEGRSLRLTDGIGPQVLASLLERALLAQLPHSTTLWRLESPRKWLENSPFERRDGIDAYRRFEISALPVEDVGIAFSVDISTAFIGSRSLDYYFTSQVLTNESKRRQEEFRRLTNRQAGQKGTLIYQVGSTTTICYFEKGTVGQTCGRTPELKIKGVTYQSLYDYYQQRHPAAKITENEPALLVSFRSIEQPVWVAARLLRPRIMNDSLPDSLVSVDKMSPVERVPMIEAFWGLIAKSPFGEAPIRMSSGFWRPDNSRIVRIPMPELQFANGQVLAPPSDASEYKRHFRQRTEMLELAGAYHLPPSTDRTIHCAHPNAVPREAAAQLAGDVARALSKWTKVLFSTNVVDYNLITDATRRLRPRGSAGTVLFVLDDSPAAYYDSAFQMGGWRLKRVTEKSLLTHYDYLKEGAWDRKKAAKDLRRGGHKWDQFVHMNALDVFVQMDGVPFRIPSAGDFEAALAIDVGYDRRYVAISLLVARSKALNPSFKIITEVQAKTDHRLESINPTILSDMIIQIMAKVFRGRYDALRSLLIVRDGEFRGEERIGADRATKSLKQTGILLADASITFAELHKASNKNVRLWERTSETTLENPLECQAVTLSANEATLVTTGSATLHQGTAEPMVITCAGPLETLLKTIKATAIGAQLNWGSLGVAQRLPIFFKRTDEELDVRYAQEIRRIA